jgi:hypothetical protein
MRRMLQKSERLQKYTQATVLSPLPLAPLVQLWVMR